MYCCALSESFLNRWDRSSKDFVSGVKKIPSFLGKVDQAAGTALGVIAVGIQPIVNSCRSAATKIAEFVKNNWHQLIGYLITWAVIVTCSGILYGFESVALPLTIGLGGGAAFGIIAGALWVNSFDKEGKYTPWNILNKGIGLIDENGTRQILLAVAVTVLLAASVVFPHFMGALYGAITAFQLVVKIGSGQNLGSDPTKKENIPDQIIKEAAELRERLNRFEMIIQNYQKPPSRNGD